MAENRSFLDTFDQVDKPESFNEEKFVTVSNKRRLHRIIAAAVILFVLLGGFLLVFNLLNNVTVPDMVGMTVDEASAWATKNKIVLVAKSVYSFDYDSGTILSQEVGAGASLGKNSTLTVDVSLGANPDESIAWPDITAMTTTEIEAWISDNKLTGVKIATANSDIVEADHVISYALTDGTEDNFQRKSRATITVSLGAATVSETVVVTDFSSMKAASILQWGSENGVSIILTEAYDDYVASGSVISQSVKANTEIKKTDAITVVISMGSAVVVPDFSVMTQDQASTWAKLNNVTLSVDQQYSSSTSGVFLSQDIAAGTSVKEGDTLIVSYSLGKVDVSSFVGKTKLDMISWQEVVNAKGANIKLTFSEAYGSKSTAGKIISQSVANDYVSPGTTIKVVVSLGLKLLAPDFSGLSEIQCSTLAQSSGVTVIFDYKSSTTVGKGYVVSQSPAANAVMSDADTMTVVISTSSLPVAQITVPDLGAMTRSAAAAWASANNITLTVNDRYSGTLASGALFGQSAAAGSTIASGSALSVNCSLGQIALSSFIGKTKLDMQTWLADVNSKGGNLSVSYAYADDHGYAMNIIVGQSLMNTYVAPGTAVTFTISWQP